MNPLGHHDSWILELHDAWNGACTFDLGRDKPEIKEKMTHEKKIYMLYCRDVRCTYTLTSIWKNISLKAIYDYKEFVSLSMWLLPC
jgi:hypothetical protein